MPYLIVVDLQNDFIDGSLGSDDGVKIIPNVASLMNIFPPKKVIFTRDCHPKGHISFASTHNVEPFTKFDGKIVWPDHCVEGTSGAEISSMVAVDDACKIFTKGVKKSVDAYSAFFDANGDPSTDLDSYLNRTKDLLIFCGIAGDYCVNETVMDAVKLGYSVAVILDCIAFIDNENRDKYIANWKDKGVKLIEHFE